MSIATSAPAAHKLGHNSYVMLDTTLPLPVAFAADVAPARTGVFKIALLPPHTPPIPPHTPSPPLSGELQASICVCSRASSVLPGNPRNSRAVILSSRRLSSPCARRCAPNRVLPQACDSGAPAKVHETLVYPLPSLERGVP